MAQAEGRTVLKGPDAFRTISEAADELGVPQHVLRFWETKFSFIRPMKRAGGRRFYRRQDLDVLRGVRSLLHEEGYTIKGVQRLHKEQGVRRLMVAAGGEVDPAVLAELEAAEADAQRTVGLLDAEPPVAKEAEASVPAGMAPETRAGWRRCWRSLSPPRPVWTPCSARPTGRRFLIARRARISIRAAFVGAWRSLVAHLTGGQGVAGSNPVAPTIAPIHQLETEISSRCVA